MSDWSSRDSPHHKTQLTVSSALGPRRQPRERRGKQNGPHCVRRLGSGSRLLARPYRVQVWLEKTQTPQSSRSSMGQICRFSLAMSRVASVLLLSCHRTVFAIGVAPRAVALFECVRSTDGACLLVARLGRCYDELSFVNSTSKFKTLPALPFAL